MIKGQSYITITTDTDISHKIIKALKDKGVYKATVIYASTFSPNVGWDMVSSDHGSVWLGYTIKDALALISRMQIKEKWIDVDDNTTASN